MAKLVYSLVLGDEIVAAVDEMAARQGYNRSALVNHILAEYTSLTTAEVRNDRVLEALRSGVAQRGLRVLSQGVAGLTVRTALSYRYNPALSYTVELKKSEGELARLRLTLRSQNDKVLTYFAVFFELWDRLEEKHLPKPPPKPLPKRAELVQEKRYQRILRRADMREEEAGKAVAGYIATLDGCLKVFFQNLDDAMRAMEATELFYCKRLKTTNGLALL